MARTGDEILLLRHALAGSKLADPGLDAMRPLDEEGRRTAAAVPGLLLAHATPSRIVSSPLPRCVETVEPLARRAGLAVEVDDALRVGAPAHELHGLLWSVAAHSVLCTHGEVIEQLFGGEADCEKGAFWVVERTAQRLTPLRYVSPPAVGDEILVGAASSR